MGAASLDSTSNLLGLISSLLAIVGVMYGLVKLYFSDRFLPRTRIVALESLLNRIEESGDMASAPTLLQK
jgi:hypothetical protein